MTVHRSRLKAVATSSAAVFVLAAAAMPAMAQAPSRPAAAAQVHAIRIEAQSLDRAVVALAEQTGAVIVAAGVTLDNRRSSVLIGSMTAAEALARLLEGANLTFRRDPNGAFVIVSAAEARAETTQIGDVVVTARFDPLSRLQKGATDSFTGLDRSLLETPRSASRVSSDTIARYGMENVDDLVAAVPGAYTASFFGVPGNLNVRGTLADTYFQGFKRIENRGSFSSNLGAAAYVEVLRGPSSPIYGPGKVGGLLNFVPKSARGVDARYADEMSGGVNVTVGSYGRRNAAADLVVPVGEGGIALYVEREDSDSYYRNIHPEHLNLQATYVGDFGDGWSGEVNLMHFEESGRIQSPGWNRVTQNLIDNGVYITGRDTDLVDLDGSGMIEYGEIDAAFGAWGGTSNIRQIKEYGGKNNPKFALDEGVGTTKLSRRNVMADDADYNDSRTFTAYAGLQKEMANGSVLAIKAFMDDIENQRFNSFGFAADYDARALEGRVTYSFPSRFGQHVSADTVVGAGYRDHTARQYESYLSGYIALNRRDLSHGSTAGDRIAAPLMKDGVQMWDSRHEMEWNSRSVFAMSDITIFDRFSILAGLRWDDYDLKAINRGETVFGLKNTWVENGKAAMTWSLSARYETPWGLTPYVTFAEPRSLESTQTGGVSVGTVTSNLFISPSELKEVGVKFSLLDGALFGGAAYYEQFRRRTDMLGNVSGNTSEGFELEAHWLATDRVSFTTALTLQETRVDAPGKGKGEYLELRPEQFGLDPASAYGGTFAVNNAGTFAELADGYVVRTMPDTVFSLFGAYTTEPFSLMGTEASAGFTAGATYVSETGGVFENSLRLPAYTLAKAAAYVKVRNVTVSANIDNLFDEEYFTPSAEVYKEVAVMPGLPRMFRVNLAYRF
ncbi:TonB-dependent receptor domain-containing protein [Brevundimonas diminuta]|uniref:TonB-dependent receptor n=1 Tax=Brevundimonas diminuta TaxID=293 RepID=A0A1Z3M0G0_BREDI|nr:TonB-dependent receptor [Brevundimonas diminuta]ASD27787.1 TonB-dependent receptor [Brevundimonas diminuta]